MIPKPWRRNGRVEKAQKPHEPRGQRSHSYRPLQNRTHPTKEKSPKRAQAPAQVNVGAACLGKCGTQFGITESAHEHDQAAQDPGSENELGGTDGARHVAGDKKNAGADGVAHDDGGRGPKAQAANQVGPLCIVSQMVAITHRIESPLGSGGLVNQLHRRYRGPVPKRNLRLRWFWFAFTGYHRSDMAPQNFMLSEFSWDERYRVRDVDDVLTPALVVYPEIIASNITQTLRLLDGNADRWRAHIKTAKLDYTVRMLVGRGVRTFKCATTLELLVVCRSGAADVLLAYPVVGANAQRVREIAEQFSQVRISVLVENEEQVQQWRAARVGVFLDINPGMNRTGVEQSDKNHAVHIVRAVGEAGLEFRGLHYYDGQYGGLDQRQRSAAAHGGYDRLLELVSEIRGSGGNVPEVITAGTPTFPCSLNYEGFRQGGFTHRVSPGTIVYCDATSLTQLPGEYGYAPAAMVLSRIVSHPHDDIVTCDAGHKAVSADAGVPTCVVVGHPELMPLSPSEEHLPLRASNAEDRPPIGEVLYLLPRHVCPTVNNFDSALLVSHGQIGSVEPVSARGREAPLLGRAGQRDLRREPETADKV